MFLECLKVHERLYGTYGFRPIAVGQVVDVYRTMVAMELQSAAVKKAAATQSSGEEQLPTSYKGQGTL